MLKKAFRTLTLILLFFSSLGRRPSTRRVGGRPRRKSGKRIAIEKNYSQSRSLNAN